MDSKEYKLLARKFYSIGTIFDDLPELVAYDPRFRKYTYLLRDYEITVPALIRYYLEKKVSFVIRLEGIEEYYDYIGLEREKLEKLVKALRIVTCKRVSTTIFIPNYGAYNEKFAPRKVPEYLLWELKIGVSYEIYGSKEIFDFYKSKFKSFSVAHDSPLVEYAKNLGFHITGPKYISSKGEFVLKRGRKCIRIPLEITTQEKIIKLYKFIKNE